MITFHFKFTTYLSWMSGCLLRLDHFLHYQVTPNYRERESERVKSDSSTVCPRPLSPETRSNQAIKNTCVIDCRCVGCTVWWGSVTLGAHIFTFLSFPPLSCCQFNLPPGSPHPISHYCLHQFNYLQPSGSWHCRRRSGMSSNTDWTRNMTFSGGYVA